jgi:hypothetical protein
LANVRAAEGPGGDDAGRREPEKKLGVLPPGGVLCLVRDTLSFERLEMISGGATAWKWVESKKAG